MTYFHQRIQDCLKECFWKEPDIFVTSQFRVSRVLLLECTCCISLAVLISTTKHYQFFVQHFHVPNQTYTDNIFSFAVVIRFRFSFVFQCCNLCREFFWTFKIQFNFFCRNCFIGIVCWFFLFDSNSARLTNLVFSQFSMLTFTFTFSTGECSVLFRSNIYI